MAEKQCRKNLPGSDCCILSNNGNRKKGTTTIDRQFEYNTYIRDFFADNQDKSLEDAIKCWKYKKLLQGHNRYERSDLAALDG